VNEYPIWRGRQWSVTRTGLVSNSDGAEYFIEAEALGLKLDDGVTPMWVTQIARKRWSDLDDFFNAFKRAVKIHRRRFSPLPDGWENHAEAAIARAKRQRDLHSQVIQKLGRSDYSLVEYAAATDAIGADVFEIAEGAEAIRGERW
jgi:hypothetical protein